MKTLCLGGGDVPDWVMDTGLGLQVLPTTNQVHPTGGSCASGNACPAPRPQGRCPWRRRVLRAVGEGCSPHGCWCWEKRGGCLWLAVQESPVTGAALGALWRHVVVSPQGEGEGTTGALVVAAGWALWPRQPWAFCVHLWLSHLNTACLCPPAQLGNGQGAPEAPCRLPVWELPQLAFSKSRWSECSADPRCCRIVFIQVEYDYVFW